MARRWVVSVVPFRSYCRGQDKPNSERIAKRQATLTHSARSTQVAGSGRFFRSIQSFAKDYHIVSVAVEVAEYAGDGVAVLQVELSRQLRVRQRGRLDDHEPAVTLASKPVPTPFACTVFETAIQ